MREPVFAAISEQVFGHRCCGGDCAEGMTPEELLKSAFRDLALSNDGLQCSRSEFSMIWNRHSYGGLLFLLLHNDVASSLPHFRESVSLKNSADIAAGQNS
jgi:hypothetical protein